MWKLETLVKYSCHKRVLYVNNYFWEIILSWVYFYCDRHYEERMLCFSGEVTDAAVAWGHLGTDRQTDRQLNLLSCLSRSCYSCTWGSFQKFCTLYVFSLKMNLFYKINLQAFSVISVVLYQRGPTFRQVLCSCQDSFFFDASDYSCHLITQLLNASETFPTEWFLQFLEQVKGWWAHVRTVRRVGKHLPSILFQNFRYCTWGMRPRVWSRMIAGYCARSDSSQFRLPFQGSVLHNRDHVACQYAHIVLYWSLVHNCRENQNDCIILLAARAQCAELLKWPTCNGKQWSSLMTQSRHSYSGN